MTSQLCITVKKPDEYIGIQENAPVKGTNRLWVLWFLWGGWILTVVFPDNAGFRSLMYTGSAAGGLLLLVSYFSEGKNVMRLLSRRSKTADCQATDTSTDNGQEHSAATAVPAEKPEDLSGQVKIQKDTLIARDVRLSGDVEGQGNITLEGIVEGHIRSFHQVRVAPGGQVTGDINARVIMINGRAEGRLYADTVILQAEGVIQGDIYSDELIIEKGGSFTGQSQPKPRDEKTEPDSAVARLNIRVLQEPHNS